MNNKSRNIVKVYRSLTAIIAQALGENGDVVVGERFVFKKGQKPAEQAFAFGEKFGKDLIEKKIKTIIFDRSGFRYQGKIKAFADGMRKSAVEF